MTLPSAVLDFKGPWPQRMFLAMGSKEYTGEAGALHRVATPATLHACRYKRSVGADVDLARCAQPSPAPRSPGTRGKTASAVVDKGLVDSYEIFLQHLQTQCGLEPWRIQAMLDSRPEAFAHTEKSWAVRLPDALRYFLRDPMLAATERRAVWTVPAQPEPGRPAMFYARRDRLPAFRETDGPLVRPRGVMEREGCRCWGCLDVDGMDLVKQLGMAWLRGLSAETAPGMEQLEPGDRTRHRAERAGESSQCNHVRRARWWARVSQIVRMQSGEWRRKVTSNPCSGYTGVHDSSPPRPTAQQ